MIGGFLTVLCLAALIFILTMAISPPEQEITRILDYRKQHWGHAIQEMGDCAFIFGANIFDGDGILVIDKNGQEFLHQVTYVQHMFNPKDMWRIHSKHIGPFTGELKAKYGHLVRDVK